MTEATNRKVRYPARVSARTSIRVKEDINKHADARGLLEADIAREAFDQYLQQNPAPRRAKR